MVPTADGLLPACSLGCLAEEARQPKDPEQIRKGRLFPLPGQARVVSDENHCISWDTEARTNLWTGLRRT